MKCLEQIVVPQLQCHIRPFSESLQFAYNDGRSTLDAIATHSHFISNQLDKGAKFVKCAFLDFSSAFYTITRIQLLSLVCNYGASGWLIQWLHCYFSGRSQICYAWQEIIKDYSQRCRGTSRCRSFTVYSLPTWMNFEYPHQQLFSTMLTTLLSVLPIATLMT